MKRIAAMVLCLILAVVLSACGGKGSSIAADLGSGRKPDAESETAGNEACDTVFEALAAGKGLGEQLLSDNSADGIMEEVLGTLSYTVLSEEEQEDGSTLYLLEITAIDMEALLEELPDDLASKDDARAEMLELAQDAATATFEAELTLIPSDAESGYDLLYGNDFINAVTGGMLDLIIEAYDLEVAE